MSRAPLQCIDKLKQLIHSNPDWSNRRLALELGGQITENQIKNWRSNHRREIIALFGDADHELLDARAVRAAQEAVERLISQTPEEADRYREDAQLEYYKKYYNASRRIQKHNKQLLERIKSLEAALSEANATIARLKGNA